MCYDCPSTESINAVRRNFQINKIPLQAFSATTTTELSGLILPEGNDHPALNQPILKLGTRRHVPLEDTKTFAVLVSMEMHRGDVFKSDTGGPDDLTTTATSVMLWVLGALGILQAARKSAMLHMRLTYGSDWDLNMLISDCLS